MREWSDRELHAVGMRFNIDRKTEDLSLEQEWLYDAIVSELEYRRRRAIRAHRWQEQCSCFLCLGPFETAWEQLQLPT